MTLAGGFEFARAQQGFSATSASVMRASAACETSATDDAVLSRGFGRRLKSSADRPGNLIHAVQVAVNLALSQERGLVAWPSLLP